MDKVMIFAVVISIAVLSCVNAKMTAIVVVH
jgi:hypothetical protein